jgi:hypothetical protein
MSLLPDTVVQHLQQMAQTASETQLALQRTSYYPQATDWTTTPPQYETSVPHVRIHSVPRDVQDLWCDLDFTEELAAQLLKNVPREELVGRHLLESLQLYQEKLREASSEGFMMPYHMFGAWAREALRQLLEPLREEMLELQPKIASLAKLHPLTWNRQESSQLWTADTMSERLNHYIFFRHAVAGKLTTEVVDAFIEAAPNFESALQGSNLVLQMQGTSSESAAYLRHKLLSTWAEGQRTCSLPASATQELSDCVSFQEIAHYSLKSGFYLGVFPSAMKGASLHLLHDPDFPVQDWGYLVSEDLYPNLEILYLEEVNLDSGTSLETLSQTPWVKLVQHCPKMTRIVVSSDVPAPFGSDNWTPFVEAVRQVTGISPEDGRNALVSAKVRFSEYLDTLS